MSEERLKRIEILLETCAKTTVANQAEIKSLIEQTAENKAEIKSLIEQTAENKAEIKLLIEQTAENKAEIKEVRQQVNQLIVQMASLSEMFVETIGVMKTMQSDIKGLQTENNRILDNLFGNHQN
jgi:uncharacterized coiled-coil DUF342 family protein